MSKNAATARRRSCDIGGCDADTAGSGIGGSDDGAAKAVTHDRTTACVDGDTGVGAIGLRIYPAIFGAAAGNISNRGHVADVDIAAGASASIGVDAVPCGASDSAGYSDALYRDVAAARDSLDTAPAGAEHRVSAANSNVAARRGSTDSVTSLSGDREEQ